jgi:hypothetical protein
MTDYTDSLIWLPWGYITQWDLATYTWTSCNGPEVCSITQCYLLLAAVLQAEIQLFPMEFPGDLQKQNIMSLNVKLIQACGYLRADCVNTWRVTTFMTGTIKYLLILLFASFLLGAVVELYRLHNTPHDLGESIVFIITITKNYDQNDVSHSKQKWISAAHSKFQRLLYTWFASYDETVVNN